MGKGFSQWWEERTPPGGPGRSPGTAPSVGSPFQVGLLDARRAGSLGHRSGASPARAAVSPGTAGRARRGRRAKGQRRPGRPRAAGAVGGGRGPRGRAHISAKFPDGRSLPARSAFPARPGSARPTQREVFQKKMPRAPRGRGAARSRRAVREPHPARQGRGPPRWGGGRPGGMSRPRPAARRGAIPPLGPAGEEGAAAGPGLWKPRSLLSACRAARTGGPPAIRTGSPRGLPAMPPAPPLQPQAPPRAGDFGACGSQNLASPSELPGSRIPESVRALGARVCSWKRGQLGSGLCARGLSPSLRQLPFSLASPTLACFPSKRKNC